MKKFILFFAALTFLVPVSGQNVELSVVSRASYVVDGNESHFQGDDLCVNGYGSLGGNFSVAFRQHLNRPITQADLFQATDFAFVSWIYDDRFEVSAGKVTTSYGSIEYDKAIYDVFGLAQTLDFDCFLTGLSLGYKYGENYFQAQLTRSPYLAVDPNLVAINFGWRGKAGVWNPVWSCNFFEYASGCFQNHLAFGNQFAFDHFDLNADLLLRTRTGHLDYFDDFTFLGEMVWRATEKFNIVGRFSYEKNGSFEDDPLMEYGTQCGMLGAGLHYFPIPNLRLHAYCLTRTGSNYFTIGATWNLSLLKK